MINNIIVGIATGIVLSIISALAYIAYKHNNSFEKIFLFLMLVIVIIFFSLNVYNFALTMAHISIPIDELSSDKLEIVLKSIDNNRIPFIPSTTILMTISLYLFILSKLPNILGYNRNNSPKNKAPQKEE